MPDHEVAKRLNRPLHSIRYRRRHLKITFLAALGLLGVGIFAWRRRKR
jgi:hypothetical protein